MHSRLGRRDPRDSRGRGARQALSLLFALSTAAAAAAVPAAPTLPAGRRQAELLASGCSTLARQVAAVPGSGPVFLQSYVAPPGASLAPALQHTAFVYDNALAAIALVACGLPADARRIADALVFAGAHDRHYHDGRLRNAYRAGAVGHEPVELPGWWDTAANRWDEDAYQVSSATGNVAWAALALLTVGDAMHERRYRDAAAVLMNWIAAHVYDAGPPPGFNGGWFGEETQPLRQTWKSTEHNVDAYAGFAWLARSAGSSDEAARWSAQAGHAGDFVSAMWDPHAGRFAIGTLDDGRTTNASPSALDAELWPLIALPQNLQHDWRRSLDWTLQYHRSGAGFGFKAQPDGIWTEGTAQAALVFRAEGRRDVVAPLWEVLLQQRAPPSGLLYATPSERISTGLAIGPTSKGADFFYFHLPHLGATAWAVLAAAQWNPFVGRHFDAGI